MARTLFTNGKVFDGHSEISDGDVVVENGRIVDVGVGLDGDEAVDLDGNTLMPGFFDCHVHVAFSDIDIWRLIQEPFSLQFYKAAQNLQATLQAGVTTVRDAGGADLGVKTAVERGMIPGPRMQISLSMISQTGGHGDGWLASGQRIKLMSAHPGRPETVVDGPDEMRRVVRSLIRAGADVIKVATSGGVLSPRDDPRHAHFAPDELDVLVAEAAAAGAWVMAHAQAYDGIKNAVRAGIRSIEHGIFLDDEAIELMVERGTYLVPTLLAPRGVIEAADAGAQFPAESLEKARSVIEIHRQSFAAAVDAGVKVAMGTDSGVTRHGRNLDELGLMAENGMDPLEVLRSATSVAAELMGLEDSVGSLRPGMIADMAVVSGDPLDFGGFGQRVGQVYQAGTAVL